MARGLPLALAVLVRFFLRVATVYRIACARAVCSIRRTVAFDHSQNNNRKKGKEETIFMFNYLLLYIWDMGMDTMTWNILNWTATTWPLTNCKHRTRISKEFLQFFLLKNTTTYCVVIIIIDDDALTITTTPTFATQSVAIECPIKWYYSINGNRPKDKLDFGKSTSAIWNLCWIEVFCEKKNYLICLMNQTKAAF